MQLPIFGFSSLLFLATTLATIFGCYRLFLASDAVLNAKNTPKLMLAIFCWLSLQAILTISGVYNDTSSLPPKIVLFGVAPLLLFFVFLFLSKSGKRYIDSLSLKQLTFIHWVRIPVEIVLYLLFVDGFVPKIMTFEGRNLDILSGISALLIGYLYFYSQKFPRWTMVVWNLVCLGLLFNIVIHAILSAPSPLQQFGFEQPNIGIIQFPISWLATFIVPVVLFSHLAALRLLFKS